METCIVYTRKSQEYLETTDVSFEDQANDCRAYAKQRGYVVYKSYREAHSGADLAGRHSFAKQLKTSGRVMPVC